MKHEVFISYSSRDIEAAQSICSALEQNDVKCWMAPRDIPAGAEYGDLIDEAIRNSVVAIVIFSETAASSMWVKAEMNVAFDEQKIIIPFRLDQTPLKGQSRLILNHKHWIDAYPNYKLKIDDLVVAVMRALGKAVASNAVEDDDEPQVLTNSATVQNVVVPDKKEVRVAENKPASAQPSRSGKKWAIAIAVVFALLLVVAGVWFLASQLTNGVSEKGADVEAVGMYPFTSQRLLTAKDLEGKTNWELRIMRNEIYARHGRTFSDEALRKHFEAQPWYEPKKTGLKLSIIEQNNINFIQQYELR